MATFDCLLNLHDSLLHGILYNWLSIEQVAKLDSAYCSSANRQLLLDILSSPGFIQHNPIYLSCERHFLWYMRRSVGMSNIHINTKLTVNEYVSNYFFRWGQNIREIHFLSGASGDLYLIPMHCKNLLSVSNRFNSVEHICHDILRFNPNLHEVAFDFFAFSTFVLKDACLPRLRLLSLTDVSLSVELSRLIGKQYDGLTHLSLWGSYVNVSSLVELTDRQKHLIALDLSYTMMDVSATGNVVVPFGYSIVHLSLRRCEYINDADVLNISQRLLSLRTLDIRGCTRITNRSLTYLREHTAARLSALYLGYIYVTLSEIAALLRQCISLHTLGIEAYDHMDFNLEDFCEVCRTMTSIKKLHLKGVTLIEDRALELVGRYCRSITHLALLIDDDPEDDYTYFTAKGMLALQRGCFKLHTLIVFDACPLPKNDLAIALWKELRPGFCITSVDSIDYDAMKCSV